MAYPKLAVMAIVNQIDKVLLIRRANEPELGKWALPGGTGSFKNFPDPEEAVKDEVKYDLGVDFTVDYFVKYYYSEITGEPVICLVFSGRISEKPAPNPKSASAVRFFSEDEIALSDLAFDHKKILENYFYQ